METCASTIQGFQTTGSLMFGAIQSILSVQCLIAPDLFPVLNDNEIQKISETPYDFIIVGAGTAGSLVANRLVSESGWAVLLLEAGGAPTLGTEIPALFINNYESTEDWNFRTESQEKACLNYKDRKCFWPRGKVLGGTSSINGMYYIIGNRKDYDEWDTENWKYENIQKYFLKHETVRGNNDKQTNITRDNINLEYNNERHDLEKLIMQANQEIGVEIIEDLNEPRQIGVGIAATTTKNGQRHCSYSAFLKPKSNESKLTVLKEAHVEKILFEDKVAVGVTFRMNNNYDKIYEVKTKKEVIISAGTINSAHILLNSGIGPEKVLKSSTKVNLPVGQNLQDHIFAPVFFKTRSNDDSNTITNIFQSFNEYFKDRKGPLSDLRPQRVVSFINTIDTASDIPNIQNHYIVVYPNQSNIVDIFVHHKFSDQFYNAFNELNKNHLIIIVYVTLLQPKSRGEIVIEDKRLKIKANYLNDDDDLQTIISGIKHVLSLKDTDTFKKSGLEPVWLEIDACKDINKTTDSFLNCIASHLTGTLYHAVGTNKMGKINDRSTVVNEKLLVKGVKNLRVVDGSVMPKIVRGNTMAATLAIAEKGAEIIKELWMSKN